MREVESAAAEGDERAILALKMYDYRVRKYIGSYAAAMGGVDLSDLYRRNWRERMGNQGKIFARILNSWDLNSTRRKMKVQEVRNW